VPHSAQYTLILHASKAMPKQCVDYLSGKVKPRRTVGVRMPGDAICQASLALPSCHGPPFWTTGMRYLHACMHACSAS
jgi:tRNA A37 threonylcarbamoyladenosine synthetase subunit TsaC/SUA5/YrdC